jgi:hypothetical protein
MSEKHGMICTISLRCKCGYVDRYRGVTLRWCFACSAAICPVCFIDGQEGLYRCKDCIDANVPTCAERAGMRVAVEREKLILEAMK